MSYHSTPDIAALNPYRHLKVKDPTAIRISNDLLRSDLHRIRSVVLDYGFINGAISRFIKHLYEHCERNNYSYSDRDTLIAYVITTCHIDGDPISPATFAARPTPRGLDGPEPSGDGRQPAQTLGAEHTGTQNLERTGDGKQTTKKGKGKGGKGK